MIRFGYFYHEGKLVVFDISSDTTCGYNAYVVALSENPAIAFRAVRPEAAIERLKEYVATGTLRPTLDKLMWPPMETVRAGSIISNRVAASGYGA